MMKNPETVQNVNLYLGEARIDKVRINEISEFVFEFLPDFWRLIFFWLCGTGTDWWV